MAIYKCKICGYAIDEDDYEEGLNIQKSRQPTAKSETTIWKSLINSTRIKSSMMLYQKTAETF